MLTHKPALIIAGAAAVLSASVLVGCDKPADPKPAPAADATKASDHGHSHDGKGGDGHGQAEEPGHGATTQLGEQTVGGFKVKASRDGDVVAGKDAAIDVWISAPDGAAVKLASVRFWIGVESARGSVKGKAEIENDNWHTHVEIPSPIPEGSKLWVEIEGEDNAKAVVGFDLKN